MRLQILIAAVLLMLLPGAAVAGQATVVLAVNRMTCVLCPITVAKAIRNVHGVVDVSVDYKTKRAAVRHDDTVTTVKAIAQASTSAGYPARKIE
jgi:periplasmic mercuric ion binding protein